jgi:hypothetical protein
MTRTAIQQRAVQRLDVTLRKDLSSIQVTVDTNGHPILDGMSRMRIG